MKLAAEGIEVDLPSAWEGAINRNPARTSSVRRDQDLEHDEAVMLPVAHLANFPMPAALDSFGSQAVATMSPGDAFIALLEYGDDEVGSALFGRAGIPRSLRVGEFSPRSLQRTLPDQLGMQVFATEAGRAFCLYVVLAAKDDARPVLAGVNTVLSTLALEPR